MLGKYLISGRTASQFYYTIEMRSGDMPMGCHATIFFL